MDEKEDVIEHREETERNWEDDDMQYLIRAKNIKKVYKDGVAAVNDNTFSVEQGKIFGLLGPNGAGKSSMFNVMTMDLKRTDGEVKIMDVGIDHLDVTQQGNRMGMCPQFNPIWKFLTVD